MQLIDALLGLGFPTPTIQKILSLPHILTRRLIKQKARGHSEELPHLVGTWFQVLFHSPQRGSFHLSLTVLVHYRSLTSI
jgi:hypothetical protein